MTFRSMYRTIASHCSLLSVCLITSGCMLPGHTSHGGDEGWPWVLLVVAILALVLWILCRSR